MEFRNSDTTHSDHPASPCGRWPTWRAGYSLLPRAEYRADRANRERWPWWERFKDPPAPNPTNLAPPSMQQAAPSGIPRPPTSTPGDSTALATVSVSPVDKLSNRKTRSLIGDPLQEPCTICGDEGPQVSYFYVAGQVVRVHARPAMRCGSRSRAHGRDDILCYVKQQRGGRRLEARSLFVRPSWRRALSSARSRLRASKPS